MAISEAIMFQDDNQGVILKMAISWAIMVLDYNQE
jgi:hypothetical protein